MAPYYATCGQAGRPIIYLRVTSQATHTPGGDFLPVIAEARRAPGEHDVRLSWSDKTINLSSTKLQEMYQLIRGDNNGRHSQTSTCYCKRTYSSRERKRLDCSLRYFHPKWPGSLRWRAT